MARNLVRFDPFAELASIGDRFFDDGLFTARRPSIPSIDVYTEDDNRLTVETYLPGFGQDDVSVDIDRGALVIQAEKHEKEQDKNKKYVIRESSTSFYRRIALPDQADESAIDATFDKGTLRVTVPMASAATPKKVAINAAPAKEDAPAQAGAGS